MQMDTNLISAWKIYSYYVTIPLKNLSDGSPESISGLTVGFNDSYGIQEYGEIIVKAKNKTYKIYAYENGKNKGSTTIKKHTNGEIGTIQPMSYMDMSLHVWTVMELIRIPRPQ